ncbi:hypothetical protein ACF068_19625 [Streptomyces sp. NPDC016309]|uniref:hypothetical protein n=1 Tax=Streptomyces sp. NPDC016309 TaxID=3364965 RepID=UPI0037019387
MTKRLIRAVVASAFIAAGAVGVLGAAEGQDSLAAPGTGITTQDPGWTAAPAASGRTVHDPSWTAVPVRSGPATTDPGWTAAPASAGRSATDPGWTLVRA